MGKSVQNATFFTTKWQIYQICCLWITKTLWQSIVRVIILWTLTHAEKMAITRLGKFWQIIFNLGTFQKNQPSLLKMTTVHQILSSIVWLVKVSVNQLQALFLEPYKQNFIFFITYENAQWAPVLHNTRLARFARAGNPYWRRRLSAVDLHVLTSLDLPLLKIQSLFTFSQNLLP